MSRGLGRLQIAILKLVYKNRSQQREPCGDRFDSTTRDVLIGVYSFKPVQEALGMGCSSLAFCVEAIDLSSFCCGRPIFALEC